jgi:hypothetical protein
MPVVVKAFFLLVGMGASGLCRPILVLIARLISLNHSAHSSDSEFSE